MLKVNAISYLEVSAWWEKVKNFLTPEEGHLLNKIHNLENLLEKRKHYPVNPMMGHLTGLPLSEDLIEELADGLMDIAEEIYHGCLYDLYTNLVIHPGQLVNLPDISYKKEYPVSPLLGEVFDREKPYYENGWTMYWLMAGNLWTISINGHNKYYFQHVNPLPCVLWMLEHNTDDFK